MQKLNTMISVVIKTLILSITIISLNIYSNNLEKNLEEIEQDIKNIDGQISKKSKLLNSINNNIKANKTRIEKITQDQLEHKKNIEVHKQNLISNLETSYIINNKNNNNINKFANIENLQQFNRILNYLDSINKYNNNSINNIKQSLINIESLNYELELVAKQQYKYKLETQKSYNNLRELKQHNLALQENLKKELESAKTRITITQYNQQKQNKSNNVINSLTDSSSSVFTQTHSLKTAKGNLILPVSGVIDRNFTSNNSKKAIFIKTTDGKDVQAIYSGQVVFSNWMRGFGFLTIINHGHGYMSLYGQSQTLLKKVGDIVEAGETIALTGASGGSEKTGLYFEIRHNGDAINPLAWIKTDMQNRFARN